MRTWMYVYELAILVGSLALLWTLWLVWWKPAPEPQVWIRTPDEIDIDLVLDSTEDLRVKLARFRHERPDEP